MVENENGQKNIYSDTLKWYAAGCLITLAVYFTLRVFKVDMRNIVVVFQTSTGIFLGGLLQARARRLAKK